MPEVFTEAKEYDILVLASHHMSQELVTLIGIAESVQASLYDYLH